MVAIDALEFCVSPTTCLKLPALKAGTSSSHKLRLRKVSRVRDTYRSMAIDTPTTNIKARGKRNTPPSLKKLTTEFMKFICALLKNAFRSELKIQPDSVQLAADLLLTLLRRLGRCSILRPFCLYCVVINHLAFEYVPIDGCKNFIYQAIHRLACQIAYIRLLPRDDIHDLGLLTVARDGRRSQVDPIGLGS